jgi:hypothetical protein
VTGQISWVVFMCILNNHFSDILYIQAAHHMHLIAMDKCRWSTATTYGEIALAGFKKYYGERAMLVADLLVRLVRLLYR